MNAAPRPDGSAPADEHVRRLARLFAEHPAWLDAAGRIREGASSSVFFTHLPGEPWHLLRRGGLSRLQPGLAPDPDFAFCFTPRSIERLEAVSDGFGAFALELFRLILASDPDLHIGFRIVAPYGRLARHGYPRLLLDAGPELLGFGVAHGVRNLSDLYRLVVRLRSRQPECWESPSPPTPRD